MTIRDLANLQPNGLVIRPHKSVHGKNCYKIKIGDTPAVLGQLNKDNSFNVVDHSSLGHLDRDNEPNAVRFFSNKNGDFVLLKNKNTFSETTLTLYKKVMGDLYALKRVKSYNNLLQKILRENQHSQSWISKDSFEFWDKGNKQYSGKLANGKVVSIDNLDRLVQHVKQYPSDKSAQRIFNKLLKTLKG